MCPPRGSFRLIDLMVVIVVIGLLVGVLLPATHRASNDGTRLQCANNMRQIGMALGAFSTTFNRFPNAGTFRDDPAVHRGDPAKSNIYWSIAEPESSPDLANSWMYNWVVEIMPFLDQPDVANAWDKKVPYWWSTETTPGQPANASLANTALGVLRCPVDRTVESQAGNLSYVVNGGFTRWPAIPVGWEGSPVDGQSANGDVRQWAPTGSTWRESQDTGRGLGVMFLGTDTRDQPWDVITSPNRITDGASQTLLVGENTLVGVSTGNRLSRGLGTNWACPLPNFSMFIASDDVCRTDRSPSDCLGGQLAPRPRRADGPGWALANRRGTYENINFGERLTAEGSFPFISSGHEGGANFVFCDGSVRFIAETIDGTVYAKFITPAGERLPQSLRQWPLVASGILE